MTKAPTFTPKEAISFFGDDRGQTLYRDGFTIIMDGPMMSPPEEWAPIASKDGVDFYCTGDGDVDDTTTWVAIPL